MLVYSARRVTRRWMARRFCATSTTGVCVVSEVLKINGDKLLQGLRLGCSWLTDIAQMSSDTLTSENNSHHLRHTSWRGAIRGEYHPATRQWDFFCPIWHTGQAIKALVMAHSVLKEGELLTAARHGAGFINNNRISDPSQDDYGLILSFEDVGDSVNTSAILECLDGLFYLSEATGDDAYTGWAVHALDWVARKTYLPDERLFYDLFSTSTWSIERAPWAHRQPYPGRPLLDDGVFLKGYHYTGNREWKNIFYQVADRLLEEEEPVGNWIRFVPCNKATGCIHPRQAYWWGRPMLMAYADSGDTRYLECARRVGHWYVQAQRRDGGLFRGTYVDFTTDSFGHATSGVACAAIVWLELYQTTGESMWLEPAARALNHCLRMQFTRPNDPNLRGAILEKVLPPDGTDRLPYHLRDVGTIFFCQAAALALQL